jgi:hypothetical protein
MLLCNCLIIFKGGNKTSWKYEVLIYSIEEYLGLGINNLAGVT